MGRFAKSRERGIDSHTQVKAKAPLSSAAPAPSEMKYFVLALAALIGLGIGWLAGKAITQGMNAKEAAPAVAERAVPATFDGPREGSLLRSAEADVPSEAQAEVPEAADSDESNAPVAVVTRGAANELPARATRRDSRRVAVRRNQRGNIFLRPFKALRRFRVW